MSQSLSSQLDQPKPPYSLWHPICSGVVAGLWCIVSHLINLLQAMLHQKSLLAATGVAIVELGDWNSFNAAPEQTEEVSAPTLTLANAIILRTSMKCLPFL